jgi:NAD(P)-dependent dehydrogenase (short-subunit alcohol dehydrogenase family)
MAHYAPSQDSFKQLKDRVVAISGGATGIGAALTKRLSSVGAKVVIGDINEQAAGELSATSDNISFVKCDVTKYEDIYTLFKAAYDKHGRVDHAVSNAGIFETGNWFDPNLTIDSVGSDPGDLKTLNVNVWQPGTIIVA